MAISEMDLIYDRFTESKALANAVTDYNDAVEYLEVVFDKQDSGLREGTSSSWTTYQLIEMEGFEEWFLVVTSDGYEEGVSYLRLDELQDVVDNIRESVERAQDHPHQQVIVRRDDLEEAYFDPIEA
ncbi:hypothetical protein [Salinibacter grassmerensis]|uniref:hypothetical protein n=1 Tax=Salinibacter grassmerensis TaxID=3040353 RepID=UPI0021E92D4C|nr:hypothetical protein [Salinibacter grassmerensis]